MRTRSAPATSMTNDIPPPMRRLFFALWPDEATRDALTNLQMRINGRSMRRDNLHLTLAFLGEQADAVVGALTGILHELPKADLPLSLDRIGFFARQRIAWIGMHDAPGALFDLHRRLGGRLQHAGIRFDARLAFTPHVTLARNANQPEDFPFQPIFWKADTVVLAESTLHADGAVYKVLASV